MRDAFFHPDEAEPAHAPRVETVSVILDREQNFVRFLPYRYPNAPGLRMSRAVVQSLLHYAIDTRSQLIRQLARRLFRRHVNAQSGAVRNLARLPFERRDQPEIV